jgi:hypothetical protein
MQRRRLVSLLLEGPMMHGHRTNLWTTARIAELIRNQFESSITAISRTFDAQEELRKAAEVEGVALTSSSMSQWRKKSLLCVRRSTSGKGVAGLIAPKPCGFLNVLDKGIPLWAMNFPRSGARSQAAKREIRPSGDRRKGPLLNSGAAPSP